MQMKNVEDIYPLSPMQQGMLFQTLYAPHSGIYCEQYGMAFRGPFDLAAYQHAWQLVVDHHPILRTAFVWEGLDEPLQIVRQHVTIAWDEQDWQHMPQTEQETQLTTFMQADRLRGYELAQAPLMRFFSMRLAPDLINCIWSYHHLLADGTSMSLILNEVLANYRSLRQGQTPVLPNRRPFRDYIAWLQEQDLAGAESFWRKYFEGFTASVPLVVDHPVEKRAPDAALPVAGEVETYLPREATEALHVFARQHQLTLNTLIQAAWALLLSRYSGETDIVFGITVSTRPHTLPGSESMVGVFINTLPLRVQVPPESQVLAWLQDVQNAQVETRQYDYSPLVEVQRWNQVPRGQPLFESLLVYENYALDSGGAAPGEHLAIERAIWGLEKAVYPLSLTVAQGSELLLRVGYEPKRFDLATVHRIAGHIHQLLKNIVAHPEQRVSDIALLTPIERQQLLIDWNQTRTGPIDNFQATCFHVLFENQVARTPDSVALTFGDQHVTYAELNRRANQVAYALRRQGVGPETLVGICMERSFDLLVGLLGILKAGGAYVPLDPAYPTERLAYMLADARIALLLTQSSVCTVVQQTIAALAKPPKMLFLDLEWPQIAQEPGTNLEQIVAPDNLAYVIYTSGSTGMPKGTLVTHAGIGNLADAQIRAFDVTSTSRVLQFASYSFDAAISEIAMALLKGATLVLCEDRVARSSPDILRLMHVQAITTVTFPPSLLSILPAEDLPDLHTLVVAGEKCQPEWLARWVKPGRLLCNAYGPSETTVCATIAQWDGIAPLTIGRPISNTCIYILDKQMQPAPVGVPGTLYISGIGLARGYLNHPELTAERFIAYPLALQDQPAFDAPYERMYDTGDIARYQPDGSIEFIGRQDTQVKLRGFRIELAEIESVLMTHPDIQAAAAAIWQDPASQEASAGTGNGMQGDKYLVAYVVFQAGASLTKHQMYDFLQQKLPAYMIPSLFIELPALPVNPNGKVDRRSLPHPNAEHREDSAQYVPPHNRVEEALAEIWEEVLGIQRVSVEDNFFELGGHSLLATQVISRIRENFQIELPVWTIFEAQTIVDLAQAIIIKEIESADGATLAQAMEHLE